MGTIVFFSDCSFPVATLALLITLLTATTTLTGATTLGVNYGMIADNLPPPCEVVDLYESQGIKGMRIFDPNQEVLEALKGSDIELMLGVPNKDLQQIAMDPSFAESWVQTNVLNYIPDVKFKYIAVGNEVTPINKDQRFAEFILPAMRNIYNAVNDAGLCPGVTVSTTLDMGVLKTSYPPSEGEFYNNVTWFMDPLLKFLTDTDAPIMFSIYPFFAYLANPNISLPYVLFTSQNPEFTDPNSGLDYYNLFDSMLDSVYYALEKASDYELRGVHSVKKQATGSGSGNRLNFVVAEGGASTVDWPPAKKHLSEDEDDQSLCNACTFNQNFIRHVTSTSGTPLRPGAPIETYIFSMFNENMKPGPETERHFGLFYPNKEPVCDIDFHGT